MYHGFEDGVVTFTVFVEVTATAHRVCRGFEDGAVTFRFSHFRRREEQEQPLVLPYDRNASFIDQLANGEVNEEDGLLMLDELFKQGCLSADQTLHALRELARP